MPRFLRWTLGAMVAWSTNSWAQSTLAYNTFVPGRQELVLLDFTAFPLGIPVNIGIQSGQLDVVVKDGVHMLRATARSTFLLKLPVVLPNDFTLEFDLIPKECCSPEDLSFEGTSVINQGPGSANVMWHRDYVQIVGGGPLPLDKPMPPLLIPSLLGNMTKIAVSMSGTTLRMFTNGVPLYTEDRVFARSRVLRVFLGGQNDSDQAVYLARLRIATTASLSTTNASPSSGSSLAGSLSGGPLQSTTGSPPAPGIPVGMAPTATAPASGKPWICRRRLAVGV